MRDLALFPDGCGRASAKLAEIRLAVAWRYRRQLPLADPAVTTIQYWRWFWPRVESEVKYQELRYTLSLKPPKGRASTVHNAVLEEAGRRARHIALNQSLYRYILQGRGDRDRTFFDTDAATAHALSEWLAALWAFERYDAYLRSRYPNSFTQGLSIKTLSTQGQYAASNSHGHQTDREEREAIEQRDNPEIGNADVNSAALPPTRRLLSIQRNP